MTNPTESIEKKIEAQLEKLKQLKAQKQAIESRERTRQKEQTRKDDTRRKVLAGSYVLSLAEKDPQNKQKLMDGLNQYLTEERDRKLFNLAKTETKQANQE